MGEMLTLKYAGMMACGIFIYAALGSVICLLSMLVKSSTAAIIVCLGYVLCGETLISLLRYLAGFSHRAAGLVEWGVQHSIRGMSATICGASISAVQILAISINSLAIALLATAIGIFSFYRYEL